MKKEVNVNEYKSVGPYPDVYGHGPVTSVGDELVTCLDCGYTTDDIRMLAHADCDTEENGINETWRERMNKQGLTELPEASDEDNTDD